MTDRISVSSATLRRAFREMFPHTSDRLVIAMANKLVNRLREASRRGAAQRKGNK